MRKAAKKPKRRRYGYTVHKKFQDLSAKVIRPDDYDGDVEADIQAGRLQHIRYVFSLREASQFLNTTVSDVLKRIDARELTTSRLRRGRMVVEMTLLVRCSGQNAMRFVPS